MDAVIQRLDIALEQGDGFSLLANVGLKGFLSHMILGNLLSVGQKTLNAILLCERFVASLPLLQEFFLCLLDLKTLIYQFGQITSLGLLEPSPHPKFGRSHHQSFDHRLLIVLLLKWRVSLGQVLLLTFYSFRSLGNDIF